MCNVTGAHYVSEGYSRITCKKIKQAHFAFRKSDGTDAHKVFCDYYTAQTKSEIQVVTLSLSLERMVQKLRH